MFKPLNKFFPLLFPYSFLYSQTLFKSFATSLSSSDEIFLVAQQKTIINYEKVNHLQIDNPVIDPNFNMLRSSDTESSTATYIVIGLLIAATIIPLATWWYFSK